MSWWKKTEEEKQLKIQADKIKIENLIVKEGGAFESLANSLCMDKKGLIYLFNYVEYNDNVDTLAYIIQYPNDYINKTSIIRHVNPEYRGTYSEWLMSAIEDVNTDRNRYLKMKADLLTFNVGMQIINKEENEEQNTTGSKSSDASEKTYRDVSIPLPDQRV